MPQMEKIRGILSAGLHRIGNASTQCTACAGLDFLTWHQQNVALEGARKAVEIFVAQVDHQASSICPKLDAAIQSY